MNLFDLHREQQLKQEAPLAARMRPQERRMNAVDFKRPDTSKGRLTI